MKRTKIGRLLREYDATALARDLGVHFSTIRRWQTGETLPRAWLLVGLSMATAIPIGALRDAYSADLKRR